MSDDADSDAPEIGRLRTSWLGRSLKVSAMTGSALALAARGALRELVTPSAGGDEARRSTRALTQEAVARRVVDSLGELKGLVMKVGQMISYMDFALPDAARDVFSKLQASTAPMAPEAVVNVFLEELGRPPEEIFAEWSPRPFAAASIGQVHRARLRSGEWVAVKVQYLGVVKALKVDLGNLGAIDVFGSLIFRGVERGAFVGELRARLLEECDYALEASHQETFRRLHAADRRVVIPRVFGEVSTRRILTTELVSGQTLKEFVESASPAERDLAGETLFDFAFGSIFQHGLFNADPHPGNYLFSGDRVTFLDFGCVKRFPPEFVERWRRLLLAILKGEREEVERLSIEAGLIPSRQRFDFAYHHRMLEVLYEPWRTDGVFQFDQAFVTRTWQAMVRDNPNKYRMNLPADWVFTNRLQWGLYAVLAALGSRSHWRERILKLVTGGSIWRPEADGSGRAPRARSTRR